MSDLKLNKHYVFKVKEGWKVVYDGEAMELIFESKADAEKNLSELFLLDSNMSFENGTKEILLG